MPVVGESAEKAESGSGGVVVLTCAWCQPPPEIVCCYW